MKNKNFDFAVYNTSMGLFKIEYEEDSLVCLSYIKEETKEELKEDITKDKKTPFTDEVYRQLEEYFKGKSKLFDIKLKIYGTEFQKKVWKALTEIPYGETRSYKEIAEAIGNVKACRAVGMANNKNPFMIIVPCHRVIGADGSLVGYAGGMDLKIKLLELEKNNREW